MSFQNEIEELPSNIESFFQGDIQVGKTKIPKLAIVGVAVGLVVIVALRARGKGSTSNSGYNYGNAPDSYGTNPNTTTSSVNSPLSGLSPLPSTNNTNPNPLGSIPSAHIPTPNLSLPDLSVPNLSGINLGSASDFGGSGLPILGNFIGNTGFNGQNPNVAYYGSGGENVSYSSSGRQGSIGSMSSVPAKKVANVGNTTVTKSTNTVSAKGSIVNPSSGSVNGISAIQSSLAKAFQPITTAAQSISNIIKVGTGNVGNVVSAAGSSINGVSVAKPTPIINPSSSYSYNPAPLPTYNYSNTNYGGSSASGYGASGYYGSYSPAPIPPPPSSGGAASIYGSISSGVGGTYKPTQF